MNQTTKKQHYVWRSYLAPWTKDGTSSGIIQCLRERRIFAVSLMNIAHENYFYGVKELSKIERHMIYEMTINKFSGIQRRVCENWLNLYCAPYDLLDEANSFYSSIGMTLNRAMAKNDQEFKNWNIEMIEKLHSLIETTGINYLDQLRQNDLSFWKNEEDRDKFSFFLCNQYFRTKRMRDAILFTFAKGKEAFADLMDVRPENMWLPLSLIFASNLGVHISQNYMAVLLHVKKGYFVVGDQPVINTYSTFDGITPPGDVELFYPVTPWTAILLSKDTNYSNGQELVIGTNDVEKYNMLEVNVSREAVFAKDSLHLEIYRDAKI